MTDSNGFIIDGYERACQAMEPEIRAEIEAKYAEELETVSGWRRWKLRRRIKLEISARIHEVAPPDALY